MRCCLHLRIEHIIGSMDKLQVRFTHEEAMSLVLVLKHAMEVAEDDVLRDAAHRFAVHLEDRMLRYWYTPPGSAGKLIPFKLRVVDGPPAGRTPGAAE